MTEKTHKDELSGPTGHSWFEFMEKTKELDDTYDKPFGWHWFWGLDYIYNRGQDKPLFDVKAIQRIVPHDHWLKEVDDFELKEMDDYIAPKLFINMENLLNRGEIYHVINFSDLIFDYTPRVPKLRHSNKHNDNHRFLSDFIFPVDVVFTSTDFVRDAHFTSAIFFGNVDFEHATFPSGAIFTDATFYKEVKFDGATFEGHTNFINTKLKKYVPTFHKATIHSNISWSRVIKHWPSSKKLTDEIISYNQNAYENLVSHMKKLDKYHDEHFFYRQEMRCRRASENFFIRFPYAVYDAVSDYGYSIGWAFSWWLGHILLGAFAIWFNTEKSCNNVCDLANNPLLDLAISFSNAHGLLPFHNGPLKRCYEHFAKDDIFNIIWGVQTIVGIPLLFLLLLTLRIRFRLK